MTYYDSELIEDTMMYYGFVYAHQAVMHLDKSKRRNDRKERIRTLMAMIVKTNK